MRFEPKQPEVEFQTGHALWALHAAGIPAEAASAKAIEYLLRRQQPFGGWMDPLQSFENFRTPFRETQMAVLALSTYYPMDRRAKGWDSPPPQALSTAPGNCSPNWMRMGTSFGRSAATIGAAAQSNEALVRQAAVEALGRLAIPATAPLLVKLLEDPSKLVQRTAAWRLRQVYGAHPDTATRNFRRARFSGRAHAWGATRVFAHHFAALATAQELVAALDGCRRSGARDPPEGDPRPVAGVVLEPGVEVRGRIEDPCWRLAQPQHPWVEANLHAAIYNLADENIRYLYNNWVALLGPEDRDRAIQGRLAVESQLADKFAGVLEHGPDAQKKQLLAALAELPLRRGDVYDLAPRPGRSPPPCIAGSETISSRSLSSVRRGCALSRAAPLMDSPDADMRLAGAQCQLIVRETTFDPVERDAGGRSEPAAEIARQLDASPDAAEIARAFHLPPPRNATPAASAAARLRTLDERYFRANIEPYADKKGAEDTHESTATTTTRSSTRHGPP